MTDDTHTDGEANRGRVNNESTLRCVDTEPTRRRTDGGRRERVLIPVPVLEGQGIPGGLPELLATTDVLLLGYHVVPEQTPPDMMRQQYEEQAQKSLTGIAESFREAGGHAETRLVFTRQREKTVDRVAEDVDATAILLPNVAGAVDSLLVPLRGEVDAERVARFVATLRGDRDIDVTLFAAARETGAAAAADLLALAADVLRERGVPDGAIRRETQTTETPLQAIVDAAVDHDAIVMGEREPDWRSLLFGELEKRVAAESLGPVLVVRRRTEGDVDGDGVDGKEVE